MRATGIAPELTDLVWCEDCDRIRVTVAADSGDSNLGVRCVQQSLENVQTVCCYDNLSTYRYVRRELPTEETRLRRM